MNEFNWQIKNKAKNNNSRTGVISTPHGQIETPAFIFCATKATLKSINTYQAKENLTQIIFLALQINLLFNIQMTQQEEMINLALKK